MIEGVFSGRTRDTKELLGFPLRVYYFDDFCKSCLQRGHATKAICHEMIDLRAWRWGDEPKKGESVRLAIWLNVYGKCIFVTWTRTDFKLSNDKVKELRSKT